jgi:hypothetical protein
MSCFVLPSVFRDVFGKLYLDSRFALSNVELLLLLAVHRALGSQPRGVVAIVQWHVRM